jgi:signal peptidase I
MRPLIEVGNVVKVTKVEPAKIRIGDIVALRDNQNVVVHRIIGKTRSNHQLRFRHRGDAGGLSGKISLEDIIGRVTVIDKAGHRIRLDSQRHIIVSRILGLRLLIIDILGRMQSRALSVVLYQTLRPIWRLCRGLLLWRT